MRRTLMFLVVFTLAASLCCLALAGEKKPADKKSRDPDKPRAEKLFNGENLDGWDCFVIEPGVKMEDVWSVADGNLVTKGEPLGYLFTKQEFSSFRLTIEWRWAPGTEPGNSGVLLRIAAKPVSFLPKCVEAQLKHGSAGDIWAFYGAAVEGDPERFKKVEGHEQIGDFAGVGKSTDTENKPGEWNKYVIKLDGPDLTLRINGKKVNEATGLDVLAGPIGLQSEGGQIEFRTVRLAPLSE